MQRIKGVGLIVRWRLFRQVAALVTAFGGDTYICEDLLKYLGVVVSSTFVLSQSTVGRKHRKAQEDKIEFLVVPAYEVGKSLPLISSLEDKK